MTIRNIDKNFRIFALVFFLVSVIISIYYFTRIYQPWGTCWTDFTVFHRAGQRIAKAEAIYDLSDTAEYGIDVYKYSPAFAYFMVPFTKLHMHKSVSIWYALIILLTLASLYFIKQLLIYYNRGEKLPKYFYFVTLFLILRFYLNMISRVQADFLVLFFLSLMFWLLHSKKEVFAGLSLATAVMIKLTPLIFIPYLIYRRFYKAAFASIVCGAGYLLIPAFGLGWNENIAYIKGWFNMLSVSTPDLMLWYKNQSLASCIFRMFSNDSRVSLIVLPPQVINIIFFLLASLMVFFVLYSCRKLIIKEGKDFAYGHLLESSLIIICMVLFSPLAWKHTFLHLVVPVMVIFYYMLKNKKDHLAKYALAVFFILTSVLSPDILKSYNEIVSLYSTITWAVIILFICLIRAACKLSRQNAA
ncbi:MAG: hypothetical protein COV72_06890 [Candidatus Omnitrophica bacterium CG11_big_fil_rev_8_21_14_0_20_42_13]|uniref:DUF2029 domain-containing protein n=1 Tax=Candidatus Ghiorseimicrobium undicola TaxID=1974746 RepID=A0A2H0LW70_9BACT|nr:MAG: hypothetical protein COV72_06890 [Candidatus Omnitrophica bacterium CG11_big_fil_rev_8_21_14_0_20_42_13]